ncbi:MAG: calcium-binding protein, partial [Caulobacter sp.]|nr:calcium-binding protein [Caulobacter sp.]
MAAIIGTADDDNIFNTDDGDTILAMGGDDRVALWVPGPSNISVDAGDGNDRVDIQFVHYYPQMNVTLTLGAGRDLVTIYELDTPQKSPIEITDFQTGPGGDAVDVRYLLAAHLYDRWDLQTNPFAGPEPLFRIVQVGDDVLLQIDYQRAWPPSSWEDFTLFKNTQVADFTADNFLGAPPDGSLPASLVVQGTAGNDKLTDGYGGDHLYGGSGDDLLYAGIGNDTLDGGDGADMLFGDFAGDDAFYGGAGDDLIQVNQQTYYTPPQSIVGYVDGGDGDDQIVFAANFNNTTHFVGKGGSGDDVIEIYGVPDTTIDAGTGADMVGFDHNSSGAITLGLGRDVAELHRYAGQADIPSTLHITDFTAGMAGDRLDVTQGVVFTNWDGHSDLIATQHLQFDEIDGSTVIRIALAGDGNWLTTIILDHVPLASLTAYNLTGLSLSGTNLNVQTDVIGTVQGTANADILLGGLSSPAFIHGNAGDDRIEGRFGGDYLYGDAGKDVLIGRSGADVLSGDAGDDVLDGGSGADRLTGGLGADILEGGEDGDLFVISQADHSQLGQVDRIVDFESGVDSIDLRGASGDRVAIIQTDLGSEVYFSTDAQGAARSAISTKGVVQGSDISTDSGAWFYMEGAGRGEALTGGANADLIVGSGGADLLTGGGGGDRFIIRQISESSLSARDTILDFQTGQDRLVLTGVSGPVVALIQSAGQTDAFFATNQAGASRAVVTAVGELQGTDIDADPNTWFYMEGDAAANRLQGGGAADILKGGGGADTLIGGGGADTMFGGLGADRFIVASHQASSLSAADALLDFETGVDKLALTGETGAAVSVIMRGGSTSVFFGIDGSGASHGRVTAQGVLQAS